MRQTQVMVKQAGNEQKHGNRLGKEYKADGLDGLKKGIQRM
ncbi:hypothetical protein P7H17_01295 [Paenibacillus larvae]|nr:hypothetical protein [Paenibacillus larvae]MDT2285018.1 hypothetical protein [Paenibacillus larvae]